MHEVGIAQSILSIIDKEAEKHEASIIYSVKIVIGEFTGVVKESLEFALDIIKKETIAEKADFIIDVRKLITYCPSCNKKIIGKEKNNFLCPECNGILNISEGKELYIDYIDLE